MITAKKSMFKVLLGFLFLGMTFAAGATTATFTFDEYGKGDNGLTSYVAHDPSGGVNADVLIYILPVSLVPNGVGSGDVRILEPVADGGGLTDLLRFIDSNGKFVDVVANRFIYYSSEGADGIAETGGVPHTTSTLDVFEVGPDGFNTFTYSGNITYIGISDAPEPEIYLMMAIGLALMGFVARRRQGQAAAA